MAKALVEQGSCGHASGSEVNSSGNGLLPAAKNNEVGLYDEDSLREHTIDVLYNKPVRMVRGQTKMQDEWEWPEEAKRRNRCKSTRAEDGPVGLTPWCSMVSVTFARSSRCASMTQLYSTPERAISYERTEIFTGRWRRRRTQARNHP